MTAFNNCKGLNEPGSQKYWLTEFDSSLDEEDKTKTKSIHFSQ